MADQSTSIIPTAGRLDRRRLFFILALAGVGLTGWLTSGYGPIGAAAVAALALGWLTFVYPEWLFVVSLVSIIVGQTVRLPVPGGDEAILLNDIVLPVLIVSWWLKKMASRRWSLPRHSLTLPLWLWFGAMIVSMLANLDDYAPRELLSGWLYTLRWLEYAALFWIALDYCRQPQRAGRYLMLILFTGVSTAVLGFIQLYIWPDFSFMVPQGWDPHVGRLLSTWFDPNFLGGYLALLITITLAMALNKDFIAARWWWLAIALMSVALVLTYSRSGYVALVIGAGLVTIIRSRTIFFLGLAAFVAIILFVPRVQERVIGIRNIDETAKLRLVSWNNAFDVIRDHPVIGVGHNLYRYVQVQYGFINEANRHSASGSDSSWLTAWVTTGTVGLVIYGWLFLAMLREAWKTYRAAHLSPAWRGFGLGLTAGLIALLAHSQFVNSFFYPHIMQVIWIFLAMAIMVRQPVSNE